MNKPKTIGFQDDLYDHTLKKWGDLIGDSLYSLHSLRSESLIAESIEFELNKEELNNIRSGTGCDYFISVKFEILNEELRALSRPRLSKEGGNTVRSNEAEVTVKIYDLKNEELLSSRRANGIIRDLARNDTKNGIGMALTSKGISINALDQIIQFYNKNRYD